MKTEYESLLKSATATLEDQLLSARKVFFQTMLAVFFVEILVMALFHFASFEVSWWVEALIDAGVLVITIFSSFWYLQIRPLRRALLWDRANSAAFAHQSNRTIEEQRLAMIEGTKLAALGELAADTAHEINNPIAAIRLTAEQLCEILEERNTGPDEAAVMAKGMAKTIADQATRVGRIIDGLRHLARGGAVSPLESVSLQSLFQNALRLHNDLFPQRSKEVSIKLSHELNAELILECRPIQIEQVLINLLNNACYAIKDLEKKWVQIAASEVENDLVITVTDSGSISQEVRKNLFRPLFTTKPSGKGNGLGLSICKRIVESHKGEVYLDNASDNTRFVIRLPKTSRRISPAVNPAVRPAE